MKWVCKRIIIQMLEVCSNEGWVIKMSVRVLEGWAVGDSNDCKTVRMCVVGF